MNKRICLFGGSFDPIHFGHLIIAQAVAEQLGTEKLLFIPAAVPPHKRAAPLAAGEHRLEMVKLAIAGDERFDYSDCELQRAARGLGISYTIDTVSHFREQLGLEPTIYWLIGADTLGDLVHWRQIRTLADACVIVTAARPGWSAEEGLQKLRLVLSEEQIARIAGNVLPTPMIEISSTTIRHRLAAGKSIRYLTAPAVVEYIHRHGLYRSP